MAVIATILVILLLVANATPIGLRHALGERFAAPVDGGARLADGMPLLGPSKTWRGLTGGIGATALAGAALGIGPVMGAAAGALSLFGDLLTSFVKRRLGYAASDRASGLDQIPEALLPAVGLAPWIGLDAVDVATVVASFVALDMALSWLGFQVGLRRHPY